MTMRRASEFPGDPIGGEALAAAAGHDEFAALRLLDDEVLDGRPSPRSSGAGVGFSGFSTSGLVGEVRPQAGEEIGIERLPDIQRAESDALLILEHMGDALGGGADDPEGKSAADPEGEAGEGGNIAPGQRVIGVLPILALDGPELAVVGLGDEVDALIGGGQLEFLARWPAAPRGAARRA